MFGKSWYNVFQKIDPIPFHWKKWGHQLAINHPPDKQDGLSLILLNDRENGHTSQEDFFSFYVLFRIINNYWRLLKRRPSTILEDGGKKKPQTWLPGAFLIEKIEKKEFKLAKNRL